MNEIVDRLNEEVKCTLAPSSIHGIGVHAIRDIKKGEKLHCTSFKRQYFTLTKYEFETVRPEIRTIIFQRWSAAHRGEAFQSPNADARLISFMNHSDTPNYNKFSDRASEDISKGEEITESPWEM